MRPALPYGSSSDTTLASLNTPISQQNTPFSRFTFGAFCAHFGVFCTSNFRARDYYWLTAHVMVRAISTRATGVPTDMRQMGAADAEALPLLKPNALSAG